MPDSDHFGAGIMACSAYGVLGSYLRPMLSQKHFRLSQLLALREHSVNRVNFLGACFCHLGLQPSGSLQSPFQFAFI